MFALAPLQHTTHGGHGPRAPADLFVFHKTDHAELLYEEPLSEFRMPIESFQYTIDVVYYVVCVVFTLTPSLQHQPSR